jgi:hypothetical protein
MSSSVLIGAVALIVFAVFFWLFFFGLSSPPKEPRVARASMLPYIGICFVCYSAVAFAAAVTKLNAPFAFGLSGACICIAVPTLLLVREHRRPLLGVEAGWLGMAGFIAVWSYEQLPRIILKLRHGDDWTLEEGELAIIATIIDFIGIWVIVLCVFLLAKVFGRRPLAPSNHRWRGP